MDHQADPPDELTIITAPIPRPPARVLLLRGSIAFWDDEQLTTAFTNAIADGLLSLIVDLGALEHADTILLGQLLSARSRVNLHLVGPLSPNLHRRLNITGTRQLFRVHANLTDALTAITADNRTDHRPGHH
ncbi:STAS domain-containing protein [Streptomyces sp. NPDC002602]|uniref:STAS domain-containing protein n=1 Tax=Streptomyces sp. NPDC002602 TaxID=3364654 RepID=UPI003674EE34